MDESDSTSRALPQGSSHRLNARLGGLYDKHAPSAYRFAFLLTGDRESAADLVQDSFVKILTRFADLRDERVFPSYLRRTMINLAKNRFRRLRLERRFLQDARNVPPETGSRPEEPDPELWSALSRLPTRQRAAVILRYYLDLSEVEAAEALQCSVPAVRSLVKRGIDTLREGAVDEGVGQDE